MFYRVVLFTLAVFCSPYTKGYTVGVPEFMRGTDYQTQVESAFTALYNSVGIKADFEYLPFNRMLLMLGNRQLDAIAYQLVSEDSHLKGALRIPEPISEIQLLAACLQPERCKLDKSARFVVVKDVPLALELCRALSLDCLKVIKPELARKALRNGLADVHIMQNSPHVELPCMANEGLKLYPIAHTNVSIYHYISEQHSQLAGALASNIKMLRMQAKRSELGGCNVVSEVPIIL